MKCPAGLVEHPTGARNKKKTHLKIRKEYDQVRLFENILFTE